MTAARLITYTMPRTADRIVLRVDSHNRVKAISECTFAKTVDQFDALSKALAGQHLVAAIAMTHRLLTTISA